MTSKYPGEFTLNGEPRRLEKSIPLSQILEEMEIDLDRKGVAIAINSEIVTRTSWSSTEIGVGDHVEIVQAIQGG